MKQEPLSQAERSRLEARYRDVLSEQTALNAKRRDKELTGRAYYRRRDELYKEREALAKALREGLPKKAHHKGDRLIHTGGWVAFFSGLGMIFMILDYLFGLFGARSVVYAPAYFAGLGVGLVLVIVGIGRRRRWWLA
jgi:hypothetical protein